MGSGRRGWYCVNPSSNAGITKDSWLPADSAGSRVSGSPGRECANRCASGGTVVPKYSAFDREQAAKLAAATASISLRPILLITDPRIDQGVRHIHGQIGEH